MQLTGTAAVTARLRDRSDQLVRGVMLEALKRIAMRTPVDTGRARGNWNVAIGAPDLANNPHKLDPLGTFVWDAGSRVIARFRAGDVAYITNSIDYVRYLEEGSSTQAPEGMVGRTVAELRPMVRQVLTEISHGA